MSFARRWVLANSRRRYRALLRDAGAPDAAGDRVWRETWWQIEKAPFWRARMGPPGRAIPPLSAFPITDYETYREALEGCRDAPSSALSGDPIRAWTTSAAASGRPKRFPITDHVRVQRARGTPAFIYRLADRFRGFAGQPILWLGGTGCSGAAPKGGGDEHAWDGGCLCGAPSAIERHDSMPSQLRGDPGALAAWGPVYALAADPRAIFATTPSALERFFEDLIAKLPQYWPILTGRARPPGGLPAVSVGNDRLGRLRRALEEHPFSLREVWPNLRFICCWKGGSCSLQAAALERYAQGRIPVVDGIYATAEGCLNVPDVTGEAGGPIHPGAHVIEFLPAGAEPAARNLLAASEIEVEGLYEMVISTSMGLVRYRLGDLVRCRGRLARAPVVEYIQKTGRELWLGPARLREADLVRALDRAGIGSRHRVVVSPAPEGARLELCHAGDADDDDAKAVEAALRAVCDGYRRAAARDAVAPVAARRLGESHPALAALRDPQSPAPRVLYSQPLRDLPSSE